MLVALLAASAVGLPTYASAAALHNAGHCLAIEDANWLTSEYGRRKPIDISGVLDRRSRPGQTRLIVVVRNRERGGLAFDFSVKKRGDDLLYTIENNASFTLKGKRVVFKGAPLGGVWTQDHLSHSIAKAMRAPGRGFSLDKLVQDSPGLVCGSYAGGGA
jgi:hypothetical protein